MHQAHSGGRARWDSTNDYKLVPKIFERVRSVGQASDTTLRLGLVVQNMYSDLRMSGTTTLQSPMCVGGTQGAPAGAGTDKPCFGIQELSASCTRELRSCQLHEPNLRLLSHVKHAILASAAFFSEAG